MIPLPMQQQQQQQQQLQLQQPQQQLMNQQQQQQMQNQQQQQQGQPFVPPPPPSGQDWTLSSVLHYIQSEWRRYERDRNEWEIERAESRARIALLEGERRSFENVKSDFMRRIKMLEYALRVERAKNLDGAKGKLSSNSGASSKGHKSSSSKDEPTTAGGEPGAKNGSNESSPKSEGLELQEPAPLPLTASNSVAPPKSHSPAPQLQSQLPASSTTFAGLTKPPPPGIRDPKSRARSREYLKQCLQEISYLTSPQAMNPLPNRPLSVNGMVGGSVSAPNLGMGMGGGGLSVPNLNVPGFAVNDYSAANISTTQQQQYAALQAQVVQQQQQQAQQQQQQQQQGQVQLVPPNQMPNQQQQQFPNVQQQQNAPGTIQLLPSTSANSQQTLTTMNRPRKTVPDVVNVFPQPPSSNDQQQQVASSSEDLPQVFPSSEEEREEESEQERHDGGQGGFIISDPDSEDGPETEGGEEDLQAVSVTSEDDMETVDGREFDSSEHHESSQSQFAPAPGSNSSSSDDGFSEPGTPASMINLRLDEDGSSAPAGPFTAIYRPDDKGAWREKLRAAHEEEMERQRAAIAHDPEHLLSGGIQPFMTPLDDEVGDSTSAEEASAGPVWKIKRALRSHLDGVRAVSWHPTELSFATGSDDNTIKIWRLDPASVHSSSRQQAEQEPQTTLRAHTAPITSLIHSVSAPTSFHTDTSAYRPGQGYLFSASLDSTIRVWRLPPPNHSTYSPFEPSYGIPLATFVGHTDAVWDIALVSGETKLVSCAADGQIKVWDVAPGALPSASPASEDSVERNGRLLLSWGYNGTDADVEGDKQEVEEGWTPTSLCAIRTDPRMVAVAFRNSIVKIYDVNTGKEVRELDSAKTTDGTEATQINKIVSHPTLPILVTAHEDRHIRIFDLNTGACTHSMPAHLDGVTSLSIDPSGFTLVSSGQDSSVRFWDLLKSRQCIQEITGHRKKGGEGVLDVMFHPGGLPFLVTCGADGSVRLYGST